MNTIVPLFREVPQHGSRTTGAFTGDRCNHCPSQSQCWSAGGKAQGTEFHFARRRIKRGQALYRMGEPFHSLYSVRSGTLRSRTLLEDGRDQVTGFHMNGELLGLDGIESQSYQTDCVALEDSEVCILPYEQVLSMANARPEMMRDFHRAMSREIVREQSLMALLGTMQADERVVAFLLNFSVRLQARGFSPSCFLLRMTREDIGSYLGLKLETVSRVVSRLQASGLIKIENNRQITIVDVDGLKAVLGRHTSPALKAFDLKGAASPSPRTPVRVPIVHSLRVAAAQSRAACA